MKKLHPIIASIVMLSATTSASAEDSGWLSFFSLFDDADEEKPIAWEDIKLSDYNQIYVGNDVNLMIDPGYKRDVNIKEPDVEAYVQDDTLYLKGRCISTPNCNKNHNAYIKDIAGIEYIHTAYNAEVHSNKLKKHHTPLTIYSEDNSSVDLDGIMNIRKIQHDSSAVSHILWLDTKDTAVTASYGVVQIAGVTNNINIRTEGRAYVDAVRLRAKNGWVSTTDTSTVGIGALNYLYAHTEDTSMVRYPEFLRETVFIAKDKSRIINTKLTPDHAKDK